MFIIACHLHLEIKNRCKISKERLGKVVQLKTAKTHSSVKNEEVHEGTTKHSTTYFELCESLMDS